MRDRGRLTSARIREDLKPQGLDWITALRRDQIHQGVEPGLVQLDWLDERNQMELQSDLYPDERLILCRNLIQAKKSRLQCQVLLEKTEHLFNKIVTAITHEKRLLRSVKEIRLRVGRAAGL